MRLAPNSSRHLTDDELIAYLYADSEDGHIDSCSDCRRRLSAMQARRASIEASGSDEPAFGFLAAQRREIYARLTQPAPWWSALRLPRWATASLAALVLGGGLAVYQESRNPAPLPPQHTVQNKLDNLSDAQLASDVSRMANEQDPPAAAPLEAFFQE